MRNLTLVVLVFASGCWGGGYYGGGGYLGSFEVDSGCTLTSTVALSGVPTTWNGCRLRYDDYSQVYTWQFTTPNSTGGWTEQAPGWFTLAFNLNSPQNAQLPLSSLAGTEPGYVPVNQVVFSYAPASDANVGGNGFINVGANIIYPGGIQSALDAHLSIEVPAFGTFTGEASAIIGTSADAGVADIAAPSDAALAVANDASESD